MQKQVLFHFTLFRICIKSKINQMLSLNNFNSTFDLIKLIGVK